MDSNSIVVKKQVQILYNAKRVIVYYIYVLMYRYFIYLYKKETESISSTEQSS